MSQIKFTTTLYFNLPEGVSVSEEIEHLNNMLHIQPELLLLKVNDINSEGKWEEV